LRAIQETELSVVCVGTPSLANGNLDLGYVARTCESIGDALAQKNSRHAIVMRSTMLPGSMNNVVVPVLEGHSGKRVGNDFGVAYYPEFLREGSALRDYYAGDVVVFGVSDEGTEKAMRCLVGRASGTVFVTDFAIAEAIKYANNAWHAVKIVFANEIGAFCKASGVDSHTVMEIVCADKKLNMSNAYMRPGFAYGGSCLPKDLRALQYRAKSNDLSLPMLEAVEISNRLQVRRAFSLVQAAENRHVGLVGLSFKGGTDDLRESPAVALAELLFGKGYQLRIFDHNVHLSKLMGANLSYIQKHIPHLAELLTTDLDSVVEFGDTLLVATTDFGGRQLAPLRTTQVLIDLVRLDDDLRPVGGIYQSLCW
jgi:GDP-mannose 6-dehydrogenase